MKSVLFLALTYLTFVHSLPTSFSTIVSFGDSYTDIGNVYRLTNHQWPAPGYYNGRFCNGPIWIDYVVQCLDPHRSLNYAYGGATMDNRVIQGYSGANGDVEVPGVAQQINSFITDHPYPLSSPLYTMWGGANDYYFSLVSSGTPTPPSEVISLIITNLETLVQFGAKYLLVIGSVPLSHLPYVVENNLVDLFVGIEQEHDDVLTSSIQQFRVDHPDVEVLLYKPNKFLGKIFNNPNEFGIKNTTGTCFSSVGSCRNVGQYVFWDTFHVTTKIHHFLADDMLQLVAEGMYMPRH